MTNPTPPEIPKFTLPEYEPMPTNILNKRMAAYLLLVAGGAIGGGAAGYFGAEAATPVLFSIATHGKEMPDDTKFELCEGLVAAIPNDQRASIKLNDPPTQPIDTCTSFSTVNKPDTVDDLWTDEEFAGYPQRKRIGDKVIPIAFMILGGMAGGGVGYGPGAFAVERAFPWSPKPRSE